MGHAIANTFKSVAGSSVTTVAGFVALCVMTFALGRDLGIVMAKGVIIGVICCVTILPALVLFLTSLLRRHSISCFLPEWINRLHLLRSIISFGL